MFGVECRRAGISVRILMSGQALLRTTLALGLLALATGCAELGPSPTTSVEPTPAPQGYWNGDGVPGSPKIVVSISEQRAYFYKGKHLVGESTVSTGKAGFGTPPGYYTVFWKDAEHVSTVFGDYVDDLGNVVKANIDSRKDSKPKGSHYDGARMPFAMFFRGGYAMHQGYVPPYAASHGCIRLPKGMAEIFFNASPPGTPVIVKQEAVMRSVRAPEMAPATTASSAPTLVRSAAPPAPVRPVAVRSTVPNPVPVRSPGPVLSSAPGTFPFRSPSPAPFRSPAPNLVRPTNTPHASVPVSAPATVISRPPGPAPLRSPNPAVSGTAPSVRSTSVPSTVRAPVPARSPAPAPIPSRPTGPVRLPAPSPGPASVNVAPPPAHSRKKHHLRSSHHRTTPSPTPSPAPR